MKMQNINQHPSLKLHVLRKLTKAAYKMPGCRTLGLYALCEGIRKHYAKSSQYFLVNDLDDDLKILVNLSEHIGSKIFWSGSYSQNELAILGSYLAKDDVFIDIGANIGLFTLLAAKKLSEGQVYSFEPVSTVFENLFNNVSANGFTHRCSLFKFGLSDSKSVMKIYLPNQLDDHGTFNEGMATLFGEKEGWGTEETVSLITLDSFVQQQELKRIDFVKIDIEGAELMALRGARQTLKTFRPKLLLEVNEGTCSRAGYQGLDILKYLKQFGCYSFYLIGKNGKLTPCDEENLKFWQNLLCLPSAS